MSASDWVAVAYDRLDAMAFRAVDENMRGMVWLDVPVRDSRRSPRFKVTLNEWVMASKQERIALIQERGMNLQGEA